MWDWLNELEARCGVSTDQAHSRRQYRALKCPKGTARPVRDRPAGLNFKGEHMEAPDPRDLLHISPLPGDVLLWHTATDSLCQKLGNFIAWRIQADQPSWCNHCAIARGPLDCVEAVASGVRQSRILEDKGYDDTIYVARPQWSNPCDPGLALDWADKALGRCYGFQDLAYIRVWTLTGWYPARETDALICSELVGLALAEGSIVIVPENGVCWMPKDLVEDARLPIVGIF
jgi:hypothetical protein